MGSPLDFLMGSQDATASAGAWPFVAGFGNNPFMSWAPQYNAPTQYNPGAFPAGMYNQPPLGGQPGPGNYVSPGQPGYGGGIFGGPSSGWQAPQGPQGGFTPSPMSQGVQTANGYLAASGSGYTPSVGGGYQQPAQQPGQNAGGGYGGTQQGNPSQYNVNGTPIFRKDNSIFTTLTDGSWMPGLMPSLAAQAAQGPAEYYPYFDVALKTQDQIVADQLGRSLATNDQFANVYNQVTNQMLGGFQNQPQGQYNDFVSRLASGNKNGK